MKLPPHTVLVHHMEQLAPWIVTALCLITMLVFLWEPLDPNNDKALCDPIKENHWMPVDLYVGGAEHAVLHLLYARFWHKVLFDRGHVHTPEPFQRLVNQGMILGENNEKMSKSRGNIINPDDVVAQYGADSLRLYEMFMGPLEAIKPWSMRSVEGVYRFLSRVWRLIVDEAAESDEEIPDPPEPIVNGVIDLGRLATDALFLAIDPYPRRLDAVFEPPVVAADPEDHPFAALKALRLDAKPTAPKKPKGR